MNPREALNRLFHGEDPQITPTKEEYKPSYVSQGEWEETGHVVSQFLGFVREIRKSERTLSWGNYGLAMDQWAKDHPEQDLEGLLARTHYENGFYRIHSFSGIKAKLLLEILPYFHTNLSGGMISDVAEIIDYQAPSGK
jgi:hypothetical protein